MPWDSRGVFMIKKKYCSPWFFHISTTFSHHFLRVFPMCSPLKSGGEPGRRGALFHSSSVLALLKCLGYRTVVLFVLNKLNINQYNHDLRGWSWGIIAL
jgi:hypothetical protein